jgi:hypothetical protein
MLCKQNPYLKVPPYVPQSSRQRTSKFPLRTSKFPLAYFKVPCLDWHAGKTIWMAIGD